WRRRPSPGRCPGPGPVRRRQRARVRREGRRHGPPGGAGTGPEEGSWQDAIRSVVFQPNEAATESFRGGSCPALAPMSTRTAPGRQGPARRIFGGRGEGVTPHRISGFSPPGTARVGNVGAARNRRTGAVAVFRAAGLSPPR